MNVRFDDPFEGTIMASSTASCGTITVTEDTGGGGKDDGTGGDNGGSDGGVTDPQPQPGQGLPVDPAILGGGALLVLLIVALTQVV